MLLRFTNSINTDLSTGEVVKKYIMPQTSQLKCRWEGREHEKTLGRIAYDGRSIPVRSMG